MEDAMSRKSTHTLTLAALTAAASTCAFAAEVPPADSQNTLVEVFESRTQHTNGPLDLRIGDLTYVLTSEQLEQALPSDEMHTFNAAEVPAEQQMEQIEVRARREQHHGNLRSDIPLGFASILWAFNNSSEAWRLFTPIEWEESV
jgi:hypothetical protein